MKIFSHADNQLRSAAVRQRRAAVAITPRTAMFSQMSGTPRKNYSTTAPVLKSTMDSLQTGTKAYTAYMDLYPETSSDRSIRLGNAVPDFSCETTHGDWESFHEWKKGKWAILFSHPADFMPVCTTEIGWLALKYNELEAMECLVATLSGDPVKSHQEWLQDVVALCENNIVVSKLHYCLVLSCLVACNFHF